MHDRSQPQNQVTQPALTTASGGSSQPALPGPIISPDGKSYWDGHDWRPLRRETTITRFRRAYRFALLPLLIVWLVGWTGWIDFTGLPISVPILLEHCSIRHSGSNATAHAQGPGAQAWCRRAANEWTHYAGPPLGGLACYRQHLFGVTYKVYDTGLMVVASEVCARMGR